MLEGKILELDGYNEELKIAFEYQGLQHYEECFINKYSAKELARQKLSDKFKVIKCEELGIKLHVIPYTVKDIFKHCKKILNIESDEVTEFIPKTYGVNMTQCLTSASLAKKFYFLTRNTNQFTP